jgi:hypothetical protein
VIGRGKDSQRGRSTRAESSIEFADMLDQVLAAPVTAGGRFSVATHANAAASPAAPELVDLVMFPIVSKIEPDVAVPAPVVSEPVEPLGEPNTASRFADAGIDDDRLPLRAPRFRRPRH